MSKMHGRIEVVERLVAPPELRGRTTWWYDLVVRGTVLVTVMTNEKDAHDIAELLKDRHV